MAHKTEKKTNAMRLLDMAGVPYEVLTYEFSDGDFDGRHVAGQTGLSCAQVYKTLVTQAERGDYIVCMVPVDRRLDLKALAHAAGKKRLEMADVKEITAITGYLRGGCSPLAMKKTYPTFIDEAVLEQEKVAVSAGVRGMQIFLSPGDLLRAAKAEPGPFSQD